MEAATETHDRLDNKSPRTHLHNCTDAPTAAVEALKIKWDVQGGGPRGGIWGEGLSLLSYRDPGGVTSENF